MSWEIVNLDMDGSIPGQRAVQPHVSVHANLRAMERHLRLYANRTGVRALKSLIGELRQKHQNKWLTLLGSGDFHHVTSLLLESLPKELTPFTLVLIDNHPDWFDMPLKYHCGTWVATALRSTAVEHVIMLGLDSADLAGHEFAFVPFREFCAGKITIFPYRRTNTTVPLRQPEKVLGARSAVRRTFGTEIIFDTITDLGIPALCKRLDSALSGKNVYLTIDKDVLTPDFALTDWDQGKLSLDEMISIVQTINGIATIIGADICGERAPQPLHGPWKRWDAGRLFSSNHTDWQVANSVNERTNLAILNSMSSLLS